MKITGTYLFFAWKTRHGIHDGFSIDTLSIAGIKVLAAERVACAFHSGNNHISLFVPEARSFT